MTTGEWTVVVPVKRVEAAKTRLAVDPETRRALARAMAADTVAAALDCALVAEVIVVTDDAEVAAEASAAGGVVVPDVPDAGLNPALEHGARLARERRPDAPVAALSADLPALRPAELVEVLGAIDALGAAYVADATGVGTTVYGVTAGRPFMPRFGPRSSARHRVSGAQEIGPIVVPSVRRDVDTEVDLWDAYRLGLGPRTREVAHNLLDLG